MHGGNKMKQVVNAQNAPAAIGPYSHCVKVGKMVFTSGQIGIDPAVGMIPQTAIPSISPTAISAIGR